MELQIALHRGHGPLRTQLERGLREGIREGRLRPGAVLPSTRALARDLGVARGTVVEAYAQMVAEGYLVTRAGAGTAVAARLEPAAATVSSPPETRPRYDFRHSVPDLSSFPRRAWLAALSHTVRELADERLDYGDPRGAIELRAALAGYLGRTRGVVADPERVVIVNGFQQGLVVLWRGLSERMVQRIGVEDPGWADHRRSVAEAGHHVMPIPVDSRGLVVEDMPAHALDAVVVTPAHQYPTGAVLAPERRAALVDWARSRSRLIVEDDYDAQYRYDREPIGAVQGLAPDNTIYGSSVSKLLAPSIRIGWLVVPAALVDAVAASKRDLDWSTSLLEQLALARLIDNGEFDRHLRRTRRLYERRRTALIRALEQHMPELTVVGAAAGLHLLARLPPGTDEAEVISRSAARGVRVRGLGARGPALVLGYGSLPEESIPKAVEELAAAASGR